MHWTDLPDSVQTVLERIAIDRAVHAVYSAPHRACTLHGLDTPVRTIELYSNCWRGVQTFRARVPHQQNETPPDALLRLLLQNGVQPSLNRPGYCVQVARLLMGEPLRKRLVNRLYQLSSYGNKPDSLSDLLG